MLQEPPIDKWKKEQDQLTGRFYVIKIINIGKLALSYNFVNRIRL